MHMLHHRLCGLLPPQKKNSPRGPGNARYSLCDRSQTPTTNASATAGTHSFFSHSRASAHAGCATNRNGNQLRRQCPSSPPSLLLSFHLHATPLPPPQKRRLAKIKNIKVKRNTQSAPLLLLTSNQLAPTVITIFINNTRSSHI